MTESDGIDCLHTEMSPTFETEMDCLHIGISLTRNRLSSCGNDSEPASEMYRLCIGMRLAFDCRMN